MQSKQGTIITGMFVIVAVSVLALWGTTETPSNMSSPGDIRGDIGIRLINYHSSDDEVCPTREDSPSKPPLLIYASASSFSFETDCLLDDAPGEQFAAHGRPGAGATYASVAFTHAPTVPVPVNEETVPATDTVTFFVQPDSFTPRTDDFLLMRQVNGQRPEVVVYNVLAYPGRPFFQYYYRRNLQNGRQSTHPVPTEWMPLRHTDSEHGVAPDTGTAARIDRLRAIEVNYRVTDGRAGPYEKIESFSPIIPLADLNRKQQWPSNHEPALRQASAGSLLATRTL